ncbi:MAG: hypothetical protein ACREL5_03060, partial [Gemmatimonadales bacterium]
ATDEHDNVWISRPGTDGSLASFDVIDSRGWYLGSVAAPPSRCRLMVFRNDRMFCTGENDDGIPVIRVYRVDRRGH